MKALQLALTNFGGCCGEDTVTLSRNGHVISMKNGHGKTTIVNAYIWVLSGKTLSGFEAKHICKKDANDKPTSVQLVGLLPKMVNRVLKPEGGTIVFYGGIPIQQKAFEAIVAEYLAPIDFVLACADLNILTDPALTPAQLRSLLYTCGALNQSEGPALRAKRAELAKRAKEYEKYALANVIVPQRTKEALTRIEQDLLDTARAKELKARMEIVEICQTCGAKLEDGLIEQAKVEKAQAQAWLNDYANEIERVQIKLTEWEQENQEVNHLEWLAENAKTARKAVLELQAEIEALDIAIREADAKDVSSSLPEGIEIQVEKVARKAGSTSSTCSLTVHGIPLKSVNRSTRVLLMVELLANARAAKGIEEVPILVDNAESINPLPNFTNVIWFTVSH